MSTGLIHHIELYVSDLKSSINFWGWFLEELGYESFQSWESGHSWKLGATYIVFVQAEERFLDVPYHRSRVGLNHLAFHANSRQQVDAMTKMLESKGLKSFIRINIPMQAGKIIMQYFLKILIELRLNW